MTYLTYFGPKPWRHILRDQLEVDDATFWSCVQDGVQPQRGLPTPRKASLPVELVHLLISNVGLSESEVSGMTKEDAIARAQRYWSEGS